jgi:hypothetical protein
METNGKRHLNRETTRARFNYGRQQINSRKSLANSPSRGDCKIMKLKTNRLWRLAGLSTLGVVLLIVVLVILFGGGFGFGWGGPGYYGVGGLVIIIIVILLLMGKL